MASVLTTRYSSFGLYTSVWKAYWAQHLLTFLKVVFILKASGSRCKGWGNVIRILRGCRWSRGHSRTRRGSMRTREAASSNYLVFPKLLQPLALTQTDATAHSTAVYSPQSLLPRDCRPLLLLSSSGQVLPCRVASIWSHLQDPSLQPTPSPLRLLPSHPSPCLHSTEPRGSSQSWPSTAW